MDSPGHAGLAAEPPEEARLDALLLAVLGDSRDAVGEVFAETSVLASGSARVARDEDDVPPCSVRIDEGVAARRILPGRLFHWHAPGHAAEACERLHALVDAGPVPAVVREDAAFDRPGHDGMPYPAEAAALVTCAVEMFRLAARAALACEPRGISIELELHASRRAIHVASSEWGHAADVTSWSVARVTARVAGADGRPVRARRGTGAPSLAALLQAAEGTAAPPLALLAVEALTAALERRDRRAPADGSPAILLAPGAGGVLVHEAVGHALEADVWERGASFLCGRLGERVGVRGLTVVDDPSRPGLAGSHARDDEGTTTREVPLIEAGVLRGQLSDGLRTGFRHGMSSGHARRASFRDSPLPRMANTFVKPGLDSPDDLLAATPSGLFVTRLERAAADPSCGDVHFRVREGFIIEEGRLTAPLAETDLAGNAASLLWAIDGIGTDLAFDDGTGTCGRAGQWLSVSVGQPTLRVAPGALRVR